MNGNEANATTPVVENVTETTPVATTPTTPVITTPVVDNGSQGEDGGNKNTEQVNYVKYRVDRAKEQAQKDMLKDLGVKDLDEAKNLIANGTKALEEVQKLQARLDAEEKSKIEATKKAKLTKLLDNEKVFDSDALVNYLDLDKVELDETGEIKDSENIVNSLKKAKPNFFGKFETITDGYIKGQTTQPMTALEKQKSGDKIGAINDYLKVALNKKIK